MKLVVVRSQVHGVHGATPEDQEAYEKFIKKIRALKPGQGMRIDFSLTRSLPHHRKLFALIELVRANSEAYDTKERVLSALKLATGHFDLMLNPLTSEVTPVPSSISFEKMEQAAFEVWYVEAVTAVVQVICPQFKDVQTAYRLIDRVIEGWG